VSRGLLLILDKIREEPGNKTLIARFLTLTSELKDESERGDLMLKLALCLVSTDPNQALEISYGVYTRLKEVSGAPQVVLHSFDVMISSLRNLGRYGKAEVLQNEKTKYQTQIDESTQTRQPPPADIPVPMTSLNKLPDIERKLPKLKNKFSRKQRPVGSDEPPTQTQMDMLQNEPTAQRPAPTLSPEESWLKLLSDWITAGGAAKFLQDEFPEKDFVSALAQSGLGGIGYHEGLSIFWQKFSPAMQDAFFNVVGMEGFALKTWRDYVELLFAQEKYRIALYEIRNFAYRNARTDVCREAMTLLRNAWQALNIQGFDWNENEGTEAFVSKLLRREPLTLENTLM
jgi:hypothetical protein